MCADALRSCVCKLSEKTQTHTHTHAHMHTEKCAGSAVCLNFLYNVTFEEGDIYIHTYMHAFVHACIHTCIHTDVYTCMYTL